MNRYEIIDHTPYPDDWMGAPSSAYRAQNPQPRIIEAAGYRFGGELGFNVVTFYDEDDSPILTMFTYPREIRKLDAPAEVQE